jgi:hypothetical protein
MRAGDSDVAVHSVMHKEFAKLTWFSSSSPQAFLPIVLFLSKLQCGGRMDGRPEGANPMVDRRAVALNLLPHIAAAPGLAA